MYLLRKICVELTMVVDASSNNVQNMLFSQTKVSLVGAAIFEVRTAYKHGLFESCPSPSPTTTNRNTITVSRDGTS